MSLKLSGDSREILAGTKGADILVYDLIANRVTTRVSRVHSDEINTVCFANRAESNIVFTGSDDATIGVWDRRTLGNSAIPMGVFIGHTEGITNIASKGDGIHLASNGKDCLLKIWDLRKMLSYQEARRELPVQTSGFDYRWQEYPLLNRQHQLKVDRSIFTFKGHSVASTLIRC